MSTARARALKPEFDSVLFLIEAGEFTETECEKSTYGLCAMFAFALYRYIKDFGPMLVFICSEKNGSPRCKSDNGLRWKHTAVKVRDTA